MNYHVYLHAPVADNLPEAEDAKVATNIDPYVVFVEKMAEQQYRQNETATAVADGGRRTIDGGRMIFLTQDAVVFYNAVSTLLSS